MKIGENAPTEHHFKYVKLFLQNSFKNDEAVKVVKEDSPWFEVDMTGKLCLLF